jgi:hypothetical protein
MNTTGIVFAIFTVLAIGIGFVWVVRLEYHVGAHVAKIVALVGIVTILISLFLPAFWASAIVCVLGGTIVWGATELPDQEERVEKGIFPANPRRHRRNRQSPAEDEGINTPEP